MEKNREDSISSELRPTTCRIFIFDTGPKSSPGGGCPLFNSIRLARAHSNSVFVGRPGVCLLISRGAGSGWAKWPQSGERSPTHNEAHVVRERCCAYYRRRSPSPHRPLTQRSLLSLASLAWLLFPILMFFCRCRSSRGFVFYARSWFSSANRIVPTVALKTGVLCLKDDPWPTWG